MLRMARKRTEEQPVLETEVPRLSGSPHLTRRRLLAAALVVAALKIQPARAQTTADTGCTIGFLNGLLQFSPDCSLLSPPALGMEVAPPSHLVTLAQAADGATSTTTEAPRAAAGASGMPRTSISAARLRGSGTITGAR
jgi:hypothetical protein